MVTQPAVPRAQIKRPTAIRRSPPIQHSTQPPKCPRTYVPDLCLRIVAYHDRQLQIVIIILPIPAAALPDTLVRIEKRLVLCHLLWQQKPPNAVDLRIFPPTTITSQAVCFERQRSSTGG